MSHDNDYVMSSTAATTSGIKLPVLSDDDVRLDLTVSSDKGTDMH